MLDFGAHRHVRREFELDFRSRLALSCDETCLGAAVGACDKGGRWASA